MKLSDGSTPSPVVWCCRILMLRFLFFLVCFLTFVIIHKSTVVLLLGLSCVPLAMNDIIMLTADFRYTHTYLGSIVVQICVSVLALFPPIFFGIVYRDIIPYCALNITGSLFLLVILLRTRKQASLRPTGASWMSNAKDAMFGLASSGDWSQTTFCGHVRDLPLEKWSFRRFLVTCTSKLFFRRISAVESRRYAFIQNTSALLFMAAIVTRAITALAHAQTAFEVRMRVEKCDFPYATDIQVLMRHHSFTGSLRRSDTGHKQYNISVELLKPYIAQCVSQATNDTASTIEIFACGGGSTSERASSEYSGSADNTLSPYLTSYDPAVYNITIVSANGVSLQNMQLPDIWLANAADTFRRQPTEDNKSDGNFMDKFAPSLITPWKLFPGSAVQASIGFIVRRFIISSDLRDTVVNLNPVYASASLFPIVNAISTPLPDNRVASAMLSASFQAPPAYLTSRGAVGTDSGILSGGDTCTIIEDYRSSTTFDALGSIGGLLAILQGLHILLFGRPMFWGIAGARLISPFGLFGRCHSRDFRRKLRETYHYKPQDITNQDVSTRDIAETIRIGVFLRDFVVDFGPADIESAPEARKECNSESGSEEGYDRLGLVAGQT